jgi:nondiscriminating glutamyl-tRNA synthetase
MNNMRVRFAPSPTGALHIGGVRTALYNYLLAKKYGGAFILRIEDTDRKRFVPGAEKYIIDALAWLGLEFDESPEKGGDFGPYKQSERHANGIYKKYAEQLVQNGHAYYAFDTETELIQARQNAEKQGLKFKYDASSRMNMKNSLSLNEAEWKLLLENGAPQVIRILIPVEGEVSFKDLVRGTVSFECSELDDKVMLKNDGMPTYHMANIVDDYLMKISHVIRGEEWLPSTPVHVLLYQFLGWEKNMPEFAHLPLILKPEPAAYLNKRTVSLFSEKFSDAFINSDLSATDNKDKVIKIIQPLLQDFKNLSNRLKINEKKDSNLQKEIKTFLKNIIAGKLSKRDGDRLGMPVFPLDWVDEDQKNSFKGFREWGFLPEAVLNILALLGWNDGTEQEIYSLNQLVLAFSVEKVSASGARFNFEKAKWFNKQYLSVIDNQKLIGLVTPDLIENGVNVSQDKLILVASLLKMRINYTSDFYQQGKYFFSDLNLEMVTSVHEKNFRKKILNKCSDDKILQIQGLINLINDIPVFSSTHLENLIEPLITDNKSDILPFFRLALSGEMGGPGIYDIMEVLSKDETISRLNHFLSFCLNKLAKLNS